jgi:hypothetical protein
MSKWIKEVMVSRETKIMSHKQTFLNSDAHFRIVVDIGGGSAAWGASTNHNDLKSTGMK